MPHAPRALAGLALALALSAAVPAARAADAPRRPNVLFLFTDDQREDTVAALGNPHIKTPHLDRLVGEGLVFRNAYCMGGFSGAVCLPSRMMLLRGRSWFAVRNQPPGFPSLPTAMKEAGYETYFHGKKGNTDTAVQALFEHSHYLDDNEVRKAGYPAKVNADDAIRFLKERKRDRPFFMYLAGSTPHDPRIAAPKYLDLYDPAKIPLPPNYRPFHPFDNGELFIRDEKLAPWPRTPEIVREHRRDYYGVITCMDEQFGRLFDALRELGEYDNTLLLFSSDQGIAIGDHGLFGKQNLYEGSMGVPLVLAGPGIPKGKASDAFAYLFDLFPTVCDLVGAPVPAGLDGKSLAPVVRGEAEGVRDTIFLAYRNVQRAVRRGRWKLIRYPAVDWTQLFDLEADPHETKDLAADPAQAGRIRELLAAMAEEQKRFGDDQPLTVDTPRPGDVDLDFFNKPPPPAKKPTKRQK